MTQLAFPMCQNAQIYLIRRGGRPSPKIGHLLFCVFFAGCAASPAYITLQAVIQLAASAASSELQCRDPSEPRCHPVVRAEPSFAGGPGFLEFGLPGGCACSRLDHALHVHVIQGGCASNRLMCVCMWTHLFSTGQLSSRGVQV